MSAGAQAIGDSSCAKRDAHRTLDLAWEGLIRGDACGALGRLAEHGFTGARDEAVDLISSSVALEPSLWRAGVRTCLRHGTLGDTLRSLADARRRRSAYRQTGLLRVGRARRRRRR